MRGSLRAVNHISTGTGGGSPAGAGIGEPAGRMDADTLFSGNALRAVDADGATTLPPFVLRALESRGIDPTLVFAGHESDPCISGYDEGYQAVLHAEVERHRLRDEAQGVAPAAHHARARRAFGLVERARYDARGRIRLPERIRRKGRIGDSALFIGTGGNFEVWNPELARAAADDDVRELAEYVLSPNVVGKESEAEQ
jgi:MraZ protein